MDDRDNMQILIEFIEIYKSEPCLWKRSSKAYHNRKLKSEAYTKLIQKLKIIDRHANRDKVVKKINSLRTNYRRELRKIASEKKTGHSYVPSIWYFDLLFQFLGDQENTRSPSPVNDNEEQHQAEIVPFEETYVKSEVIDSDSSEFNSCSEAYNYPTSFQSPSPRPDPISLQPPAFQSSPTLQPSPAFQSSPTLQPSPAFQPSPTLQPSPAFKPSPTLQSTSSKPKKRLRTGLAESTNNDNYRRPKEILYKFDIVGQNVAKEITERNDIVTQQNVAREIPDKIDIAGQNVTRETQNRFDIVGQNVAMKLRYLSNDQRIFAERLINDALYFAEMGSLKKSHQIADIDAMRFV